MTKPLRPGVVPAAERRVIRPARRGERPRPDFILYPFLRGEGAGPRLPLDRNLVERNLNDEYDLGSPFERQSPVFGLVPALAAMRVVDPDESNESEEEQNRRFLP